MIDDTAPVDVLKCLEALGGACAEVTLRLRAMQPKEQEFWATRAYQATDRQTRQHQKSYGRRRATRLHSQWRTFITEIPGNREETTNA